MKLRLLSLVFLSSLSVSVIACGDEDDGPSAAVQSCYDSCQAQEDGGCALFSVSECQELCDAIVDALDSDCQSKADAAYSCQVSSGSVCDPASDACTTEIEEYNACLM